MSRSPLGPEELGMPVRSFASTHSAVTVAKEMLRTSPRKRVALPDANALNKAIAMDMGKEMVAYLEVMYPDVFHAMNSGCRLSIRNHIHNDIIAALEVKGTQAHLDRIAERTEFRRNWLKAYRDIRKRSLLQANEVSGSP